MLKNCILHGIVVFLALWFSVYIPLIGQQQIKFEFDKFDIGTQIDTLNQTGEKIRLQTESLGYMVVQDYMNIFLENGDQFGSAIANLGELDGNIELAIGAPFDSEDQGTIQQGAVYFVSINPEGRIERVHKLSNVKEELKSPISLQNYDHFGSAVTSIGDINKDGYPEIVIGSMGSDSSAGALWILTRLAFNKFEMLNYIDITNLAISTNLSTGDAFGSALTAVGDLNGDEISELAVGAPGDDAIPPILAGGVSVDVGSLWILFINRFGEIIDFKKIGLRERGGNISALASRDRFGSAITNIGDLDGDGIDELAVGAPEDNPDNDDVGDFYTVEGSIYTIFLKTSGDLNNAQLIRVGEYGPPSVSGDSFGSSIAPAGDLNDDGVPDIIVGAAGDDEGGDDIGNNWIINLTKTGEVKYPYLKLKYPDGSKGIVQDGDGLGSALANLGDLNKDGSIDFIVGARLSDNIKKDAGATLLMSINPEGNIKMLSNISKKVLASTSKSREFEFINRKGWINVIFSGGSSDVTTFSIDAFDVTGSVLYSEKHNVGPVFTTILNMDAEYSTKVKKVQLKTTEETYLAIDHILLTVDTTGPELQLSVDKFQDIDESMFNISALISDNLSVDRVELVYRGITESEFKRINLNSSTNEYAVSVPSTEFDEIGLEYFVEAEDNSGIVTRDTSYAFWQYRDSNSPQIPDLKFGGKFETYQMISIPLELSNSNIDDIFDELGAYGDKNWRFLHYDDGGYNEYNDGLVRIEIGKGYWLNAFNETIINVGAGNSPQFHQGTPFSMVLKRGWNQIGNPYNFNIAWEEVKEYNGNPVSIGNLYVFNDGEYAERNVLKRFGGAFVWSDIDTSILIPVNKNTTIQSGRIGEEMVINNHPLNSEDSWEVQFKLRSGSLENIQGGFGMNTDAHLSKDHFDLITIPRFSKFLELNFYHSEYFEPRFSKDIVPLKDNFIWEFTVETNSHSDQILLSWDNTYFGANDLQLFLMDIETQKLIDMRLTKTYQYNFMEDRKFKVFYGDRDFIDKYGRPDRVSFISVAPNPIISQTIFSFALPDMAYDFPVSLNIYSIQGQHICNLLEGLYQGGFYKVVWDGVDEKGSRLCSGIYISKLTVGNFFGKTEIVQKIVIK